MKPRNTMRWLTALTLLFAAQAAWAQGPPPSREEMEQRERERMAKMSERLQLTEEQEPQVQAILDDTAGQMRAKHDELRSKDRSPSSHRAMQQEMQKIEKATRERLVPILSGEQLEAYDRLQAEWAEERKDRPRGRQGRREPR